jgi:hypothetical protein
MLVDRDKDLTDVGAAVDVLALGDADEVAWKEER